MNDIVVEIPGAKHPEQKVVVGAHYDGWTYGTDDNTSAWTAVMEIGRGLSRLLERGWQPDRTIVLVGWDGEEYGLLGSTEWVEQYRDELRRDAVAYLNMDGVGGREFGASSVPSLDALIEDVTTQVRDPERRRHGLRRLDRRGTARDRPSGQRLRLHRLPRPRGRALARHRLHDRATRPEASTTPPTTTPT